MTTLNIIPKGYGLTMSSREIAGLTGSTHDNVLKTIRSLVERGIVSGNATPYKHPQNGQTYQEFCLTYRDSMVVVSGYSVELRARIIDRWQELEAQQAPIPLSFADALRMAADQAERIDAQQKEIEHQRPAVEFFDSYVDSTGLKGFREVAKLLGANEVRFRKFLSASKVMYLLNEEWTAYQHQIGAGRFTVRTGTSKHSGHTFNRAMFTPKGVEWIASLWRVHSLRGEVAHD